MQSERLQRWFDDVRILVANSREREREYRQWAKDTDDLESRARYLAEAERQAHIVKRFEGFAE